MSSSSGRTGGGARMLAWAALMLGALLFAREAVPEPWPTLAAGGEAVRLYVLNVPGQAILLRTPEHDLLIGTGAPEGAGSLAAKLWALGVTGLDLVILTAPSADRVGGLPLLLQQFPINAVWDGGWKPIGLYGVARRQLAQVGGDYRRVSGDVRATFGQGVSLQVLATPDTTANTAVASEAEALSLIVGVRQVRMLLPGTLELASQERLLRLLSQPGDHPPIRVLILPPRQSPQQAALLYGRLKPHLLVLAPDSGPLPARTRAALQEDATHVVPTANKAYVMIASDGTGLVLEEAKLKEGAHAP